MDIQKSTYNSTNGVFYTDNSYANIFQFQANVLFPYEELMEREKDGKISSIFFFWQHLFSFNHLTFPLNRQWGLLWQDAGNKHNLAVCLLCTCSEKGIQVLNHQLFFLSWRRQDRCIKKEKLFCLKYSHANNARACTKTQQICWIPDWSTPGLN